MEASNELKLMLKIKKVKKFIVILSKQEQTPIDLNYLDISESTRPKKNIAFVTISINLISRDR